MFLIVTRNQYSTKIILRHAYLCQVNQLGLARQLSTCTDIFKYSQNVRFMYFQSLCVQNKVYTALSRYTIVYLDNFLLGGILGNPKLRATGLNRLQPQHKSLILNLFLRKLSSNFMYKILRDVIKVKIVVVITFFSTLTSFSCQIFSPRRRNGHLT